MPIQLLDADVAEYIRLGINNDPEFKLVAREMKVNLVFKVGSEQQTFRVREGEVRTILNIVSPPDPLDVNIKGANEFWKNLLLPVPPPGFQNFYAAIRVGNCDISGNDELYNAYFPAINRMIDVIRELRNDFTVRRQTGASDDGTI